MDATQAKLALLTLVTGGGIFALGYGLGLRHNRGKSGIAAASAGTSSGAPGQASARQGSPQSVAAAVGLMLSRSDDAAASLRDLAEHAQDARAGSALPCLLANAGLLRWDDAPALGCSVLWRNGRLWLTPASPLDAGAHNRLIGIEAALNVGLDLAAPDQDPHRQGRPLANVPALLRPALSVVGRLMREGRAGADAADARRTSAVPDAAAQAQALLASVLDLVPKPLPRDLGALLEGSADPSGEWALRMGFANFIEDLPLPVRVTLAGMQADVASGLFCADLCVPAPAAFAFAAPDDADRQAALARAYALRVSLLAARGAFASCKTLATVVVNCRQAGATDLRPQDGEAVLSVRLGRSDLARLVAQARPARALDEALPDDPCLRRRLGQKGVLLPVEPFLTCDAAALCPEGRWRAIELDESPAPDALRRATGAARYCDLSLNEKAGRVCAWNDLAQSLDGTTADAVRRLVGLRDSSADLTVSEACERTSKALVAGTLDVANTQAMADLFIDGGSLGTAVRRAEALLKDGASPSEAEQALAVLDKVLGPVTNMGIYLDDSDSVYRYFNSIAERVRHNLDHAGDQRQVRLVPDEYYAAHSLAVRILNGLGRPEEALAHAEELCRVAPVTPDAALSKVRCLEELTRIFEAADVLASALTYASTARDLSVVFYRLAFMEWRLGRGKACVACYQRAIALHPDLADQARAELADLLDTEKDLAPLPPDEERAALEAAGIPSGDATALRDRTRDAVVACVDAGLFSVARPLLGVLLELNRDDALVDVYRSIGRS